MNFHTFSVNLWFFRIFCRNTEKYGLRWTIITIISLAVIMNSPCYLWYFTNYTYFAITRCFQFVVQAAIPSTLILILNVFMYKKLKQTKNSVDLNISKDETIRKSTIFMSTRESLKKSIFRAKLTLSITGIFVGSQLIMWIPTLPYEVIFLIFP